MKRFLTLCFLLLSFVLKAQNQIVSSIGSVDNFKNIEHNLNYLQKSIQLSNGDSFIFINKMNTFTTMDVFIVKLNSNLDTLWTYKINTPDNTSIDVFKNGAVDSNGNLYVHSMNFVYFNSYETTSKHYVTKLNSAGDLIFEKSLGEVAASHNDTNEYFTTNFDYQFAHVDDEDNFVVVFSAHSPTHRVSFFKFLPNNSTEIIHRTDVYSYNPSINQNGYFVRFFYLNGYYYYLSGVIQSLGPLYTEYRLNKMLNQGFSSLDITPYVVSNQFFLQLRKAELKANALGNVLYFSFDSKNITDSFFTLAVTNNLQYLGRYHDEVRFNKFHNSQVLNNGNIRLFGNSFQDFNATSSLLSEVTLSTTGTIVTDSLHSSFGANQIIPINSERVGLIHNDSIQIVNNQWERIDSYQDFNIKGVQLITVKDSVFYVYGELHDYIIPNSGGEYDDVKPIVRKLGKDFLSLDYVYSSEGNANCRLNAQNIFLSDHSSIISYKCSYGYNTGYGKNYIKKLDANYNEVFDIEVHKNLTKIFTTDNQDNIYYGSFLDERYLTKRSSNGSLLFETAQNNFDEILIFNNKLYLVTYDGDSSIIDEINKVSGNVIQSFVINQSRPVATFTQGIDNYRFYLIDEYSSSNPNVQGVSLQVYKNFELLDSFYLGDNLSLSQSAVLDDENQNIYFILFNNSYSSHELFKVSLNGDITSQIVSNNTQLHFVISHNLYISNSSNLYQYDKNTITLLNQLNNNFSNRFFKYNNKIIATNNLSQNLKILSQDLVELENLQIENDFNFLSIDSLNRLHFNNSITEGYILGEVPRWFISNTKMYDFGEYFLSNEDFEIEKKAKMYVYPNPSSEFLSINESELDQISAVNVYDLNGSVVLKVSENEIQENKINISFLSSGLYILVVQTIKSQYQIKFFKN